MVFSPDMDFAPPKIPPEVRAASRGKPGSQWTNEANGRTYELSPRGRWMLASGGKSGGGKPKAEPPAEDWPKPPRDRTPSTKGPKAPAKPSRPDSLNEQEIKKPKGPGGREWSKPEAKKKPKPTTERKNPYGRGFKPQPSRSANLEDAAQRLISGRHNTHEEILENINKPPEAKPPEAKPPEAKPPEAKRPRVKPPEAKPSEVKRPKAKPPEAKPPKVPTGPIDVPEGWSSKQAPTEDSAPMGSSMASVMANHIAQEMKRTHRGDTEEEEETYGALENFLEGKLTGAEEQEYSKAVITRDWNKVADFVKKSIDDLDLSLEDIEEAGVPLPDASKIGKDWKLKKDPRDTHIQKELEPSSMDSDEIRDWMRRNESRPKRGKIGGLDQLEAICRIKHKNTELEYSDSEYTRGLARMYIQLLGRSDVPEEFTRYTKRISFSDQDAASKHKYTDDYNIGLDGKPIMGVAFATGDGSIVVGSTVSTNPRTIMGTLAHETGHNFAEGFWGDVHPPKNSKYGIAQAKEPPVTPYGATDSAEDFAEACKIFFGGKVGMSPEAFARKFPLKHAALTDLFVNKNFEVPEGGWDYSPGDLQRKLDAQKRAEYRKKSKAEIPEGWSAK